MKKLLLIFAMAIMPMLVSAYDFMVNGVAYKVLSLDNLEVEVTVGCEADNDGKLTIPATVEYKGRIFKVLGVGDKPLSSAIVSNTLKDLTIEEGPTYIGVAAFQGKHLSTIKIPKTITVLRDAAFEGNNWYMPSVLQTKYNPISVIIEDSEEMLTYKYTTFATTPLDNNNIKYLYLGRNVNNYVLSGALNNVEDFVIGDMVTELTTESLTHLSTSLRNVKNITIGKSLSLIPYMKEGDKIEKIYVRTMKPQNSLGFNDGTFITATLYVPKGSKEAYMNADVWKNFWSIEEYDLDNPGEGPNTNNEDVDEFYVNALGYRILSKEDLTCEVFHCNHGSEVHVPGEVTYGDKTYKVLGIGESAFQGSNITSLSMDNSLTYIRERACAICLNLRKVVIPPSVVNLGEGAFGSCTKLETFIIEDGDEMLVHKLNNYYYYTFASDAPLKTVYIGRNFSKDIFYGGCCSSITDLTIGDHVTNFELDDFPSLLKLTIGKGLTYLPYMETGNYLTKIIVNASTPISSGGFNNRTYLDATLYVPEGSVEAYSTTEPWSKFLSITDGRPTSIKVSPSTKSIMVGESFTATYSFTPSGTTATVTWSSSDPSIASVDESTGVVTGIKKGIANIYANTSNGLSDYCEVTVEEEVNDNNFTSIGIGTLLDNFYEGETQVEILQDQDNKEVFKILNPYDGITNMKGSSYYGSNELEINIMSPGMTLHDVDITKNDLIFFKPINTGYYFGYYNSYIDMYHPSAFSDYKSEDFWTYNKVLGYQNNGWPDKIQLAPYYYMDDIGGWDYTQQDNVIIITFPRDPTGINDIKTDEDKNIRIYDLMGRRLERPRKGINIIGGKKVYIK